MGMKLKELRVMNNFSQNEIAQKVGLKQFTYSNYETGFTEPKIQTLIELANIYNVSLDYLVGREFNNEFGYLSDDEKTMIKALRTMSSEVREKTKTIIIRMLAEC